MNTHNIPSSQIGVDGISEVMSSRKRANNTARGLLFGGLATMGVALGAGALTNASADNEVPPPLSAQAPATETVTVHVETVTVTADPVVGEEPVADESVELQNEEPISEPLSETHNSTVDVPAEELNSDTDGVAHQANISTTSPSFSERASALHDLDDDVYGRHAELFSGDSYIISSGDTLASIAQRSGVSVTALAKHNNINNVDVIYAGNTITIP